MRAAVVADDGGFRVVERPDPSPAPDELVVRIAACGVCGSDLKALPFIAAGTVMGHELGGEVVAAGASARAEGWREGTVVAVLPVVSCGECGWCTAGHVAHCPSASFVGMGTPAGGFAELAAVPARHAFVMPDSLPLTAAALVEPFAVGYHAVTAGGVTRGRDVLVIGAGGVGLTAAAWARALGANRVTVADPERARRDAAARAGAHDTLASIDDAETGRYDVVIECAGRPGLIAGAAAHTRARGTVVIAGACEQPVTIEPVSALLNEVTFRFSVAYTPGDFTVVTGAFSSGLINPSAAAGRTFDLEHLTDAFDAVRDATGSGRVLVTPRSAA
jgi:(R,R)-butanediol dehydrogenase / meso-butanediol dehydrogenase / diacetyl reductase